MTPGPAVRLALSWLTVLPVPGPATVDRQVARGAIALAPMTGLLLGLAATGVLWLADWLGMTPALAGLLAVAALALLSRGMHLDGLADTFDGLGSYGPPERARDIMRTGGTGPFGAAAIVFCVAAQALSLAEFAASEHWWAVLAVVFASRVPVVLACHRGSNAAPGSSFGALVANTQPYWLGAAWTAAAIAVAVATMPGRWWLAGLSVVAALLISHAVVRHCVRRFGGLSGDVLGAAIELALTISAVLLTIR